MTHEGLQRNAGGKTFKRLVVSCRNLETTSKLYVCLVIYLERIVNMLFDLVEAFQLKV